MEKKTIKDITVTRGPRRTAGSVEIPVHVVKSLPREVPYEPDEPKPTSRYGLWYLAVAVVIGFLFSLSFLFEHANVSITPKSVALAFDTTDSYSAQKDTVADSTIAYTQMTLSGDESIKLPSTESKTDSQTATGTVILYNAYSKTPYALVENTRLATPAGKIYRINAAVSIPGSTGSGTTFVPGSVTVGATAAEPGEDSNIDKSDFSIPGLAGTPQFAKVYGRTNSAMAGGTSGTVYTVPTDAANAALGTLGDKLKASLIAKARAEVPDGYILYDGATTFASDNSVQAPYSKTPEVPLVLHGTLTAYLLKEDTLVTAIAEKSVSQYGGEPVTIQGLSALVLKPVGTLSPDTDTSFAFSFDGKATVVWAIDQSQVSTMLAGRKKSEFETLIAGVVGVEKAQVVLKPFWKQSFPDDQSRITVSLQKID